MSKEKPIIPSKREEKLAPLPRTGTTAFAVVPDGSFWTIWKFFVKDVGDIEVSKEAEMLPYDAARLEVGRRVIEEQAKWLK